MPLPSPRPAGQDGVLYRDCHSEGRLLLSAREPSEGPTKAVVGYYFRRLIEL